MSNLIKSVDWWVPLLLLSHSKPIKNHFQQWKTKLGNLGLLSKETGWLKVKAVEKHNCPLRYHRFVGKSTLFDSAHSGRVRTTDLS